MCGIVGKIRFDGGPIDGCWLRLASDLLAHRGPDGYGELVEGGGPSPAVALGHRRLRIIDLSTDADQPMRNTGCAAAGRAQPLAVVFNGEIYNYRELRHQLEASGHRFKSHSDTEVLLHLYEDHGVKCVEFLRGMFAFALWDAEARRMIVARDRVGKKPLYYRFAGNAFWFASEPRAILSDPGVPIRTNAAAVHAYLKLGYVPTPISAYEGLQRLPPAHVAIVETTGVHLKKYWSVRFEPKRNISAHEAIAELSARVDESVRIRLMSDVPLGAFLSGGLDSSAVVAAMSTHAAGRVKTFSIGFDDPRFDELQYARLVARRYQTDHHEFIVKPELETVLPKLAWHYGEPFADSSAVPTYHLARLAREHITVALNGDGGDESFAGYRRYVAHRTITKLSRIAGARTVARVASSMLPSADHSRSKSYDIARFLSGFAQTPGKRYASWFGFFDDPARVLDEDFLADVRTEESERFEHLFSENCQLDPVDAAMAADIALYLPDDLLVKVDIATMAHGLEARSPLLDHLLMEDAARLAVAVKLPRATTKPLLRAMLRGKVPGEILSRRKMGFGIPLDRWLREELRQMSHDILLSSCAMQRRYVKPGAVERLLQEHDTGRATHAHRIWALLMLELWELSTTRLVRANGSLTTVATSS